MLCSSSQNKRLEQSQQLVEALQQSTAYPHLTGRIRVIETHISWILLTGEFAYKVKKPLNLGFLDFSTLEARKKACFEELRLNQRMAAGIYLDVVVIGGNLKEPRIGFDQDVLEYAVRMKQFPDDAVLDIQLKSGRLTSDDMEQLAARLVKFHATLMPADENSLFGESEEVCKPAAQNFLQLNTLHSNQLIRDLLQRIEPSSRLRCSELDGQFRRRKQDGWIRECHGDLHLGNLVRLPDGITGFDALEFDPALRWIDVMSEVAFLVMDLEVHGHQNLAYRFLNRYLQHSGDYQGLLVLRFYIAYRAMVRAKILLIRDEELQGIAEENSTDYSEIITLLELASHYLENENPILIITIGLSGSGKTTVATQLADFLPAIHVRSDIERKRLYCLAELDRTDSQVAKGIYSPEAGSATYGRLAELAEIALRAQANVIIDAACLRRSERAQLQAVADSRKCSVVLLYLNANQTELKERIQTRAVSGRDASEADSDVLDYQIKNQEGLSRAERERCIEIDTSTEVDVESLLQSIRMISNLDDDNCKSEL